jgi:hypothetical protein
MLRDEVDALYRTLQPNGSFSLGVRCSPGNLIAAPNTPIGRGALPRFVRYLSITCSGMAIAFDNGMFDFASKEGGLMKPFAHPAKNPGFSVSHLVTHLGQVR